MNIFAEKNKDDWLSAWSVGTFTDDFGDPTNEKFIQTRTQGTFANSATTDSDCAVRMIVTKESVGIFLYEYNRQQAATFIGDIGVVNMKKAAGKTGYSVVLGKWNMSGGISVRGYPVIKMFKISKGYVKFVVNDNYSSVYKISINADGFIAELNKL